MIAQTIDAVDALYAQNLSPGVHNALYFALTHIGVCEQPPGSNRGPEIDAWCQEFGSPLGSYWCALSIGKARKVGGLWVPSDSVGACNEWVYQATTDGLTTSTPVPGAAVVYGNGTHIEGGRYDGELDAVHIGIVLRVEPVLLSIEGNTTLEGESKSGWIQTLKEVNRAHVLTYILPGDHSPC
jgi:hypothetical protein